MTTDTHTAPSPIAREARWPRLHTPLSLRGLPVLLAADGSPEAAAATHFALALQNDCDARINVLTVTETHRIPIAPPLDMALGLSDPATAAALRELLEEETQRTILNVLGQQVEWPVRIAPGVPAEAIAREAARLRAAQVVIGLRPPGRLERALHLETTPQVIHAAACPVLGVSREGMALPRRVLVAVDFGHASLEAARAARALMRRGGRLMLVYVAPATYYGPEEGATLIHDLGVDACFERLVREVGGDGVEVERVVLPHDGVASIASILLERAATTRADLVAAGSSRYGRVERMLLGSVSTDLIREGRHSTLIVPPCEERAA